MQIFLASSARRLGGNASEKGSALRTAAVHRIGCTFWVVQALGFQFSGTLQHIKHVRNQMPACSTSQKDAAPIKPKGGGSEFVPSHIVPALFLLINSSAFGVQALLLLALPLVKGVSSISYTYQFRLWAAVSNVRRRASVQCSFPSALRVQCVSRPA